MTKTFKIILCVAVLLSIFLTVTIVLGHVNVSVCSHIPGESYKTIKVNKYNLHNKKYNIGDYLGKCSLIRETLNPVMIVPNNPSNAAQGALSSDNKISVNKKLLLNKEINNMPVDIIVTSKA